MSLEKILRYTAIGLIFSLLITPFIVSNSLFFPFITGKNFFFRIVVELLVGVWAVLAIIDKRYRPNVKHPLFIAIASFVGIMAVANIFSENALKSFWSNFERMMGFVNLVHLLAYFVVTATVLNTEKLWRSFLTGLMGVGVLLGFYGLFQLAGIFEVHQGGNRLDATLGNATYLAAFMLFSIFLTLYLWVTERRGKFVKGVYGAVLALQLVILFYTQTRGAILGVMGGFFLVALLIAIFEKGKPFLRKTSIGLLIFLVVLAGAVYLGRDTKVVQSLPGIDRIASIELDQNTVKARFLIWGMSLEAFQENPVLGWGQESFNFAFNKYYNPEMYNQEPWFDRAHSIIFDWLVAGGALGLLAFLSILALWLYYAWSRKSDFTPMERYVFTGLLAAYGFHGIFVFDNLTSYMMIFAVLAFVYYRSEKGVVKSFNPHVPKEQLGGIIDRDLTKKVVIPVMVVLVPAVAWTLNGPSMMRANTLIYAMSPSATSDRYEKNLEMFEKTLNSSLAFTGDQEVRERLVKLASRVANSENIPGEVKQEFFNKAEKQMQKQLDRVSNDARVWLFLGSLYNSYGKTDKALEAFRQAQKHSPKKQSILNQLGLLYISKGNLNEGLKWLKKSFELLPKNDESRMMYAVGAIYADKNELANKLLEEGYGTTTVDNQKLINAYVNSGQYDKAVAIWKKKIKEEPQSAKKHVSLANIYQKAGQTEKVIEELKKAAEINPELSSQIENYIKNIRAGSEQ